MAFTDQAVFDLGANVAGRLLELKSDYHRLIVAVLEYRAAFLEHLDDESVFRSRSEMFEEASRGLAILTPPAHTVRDSTRVARENSDEYAEEDEDSQQVQGEAKRRGHEEETEVR